MAQEVDPDGDRTIGKREPASGGPGGRGVLTYVGFWNRVRCQRRAHPALGPSAVPAGAPWAGSVSVHRRWSLSPELTVGVPRGFGVCFSTTSLSSLICMRGPFWMGDGTCLLCSHSGPDRRKWPISPAVPWGTLLGPGVHGEDPPRPQWTRCWAHGAARVSAVPRPAGGRSGHVQCGPGK